MVPHSSTLAWKIPWTGEPGGFSPWNRWESDTTEWLHFHLSLSCTGEGNGNPLQCSCLENPRDGVTWWAAIYGVTPSRTWLKQLSSSSNSQSDLLEHKADHTTVHLVTNGIQLPLGHTILQHLGSSRLPTLLKHFAWSLFLSKSQCSLS